MAARGGRKWSQGVTENSDALDLDRGVFTRSPVAIARSLKRSAERSRRRKSSPYRSAMSMLTFFINRAGRNLSAIQRRKLEAAKAELRRVFQRARPDGSTQRATRGGRRSGRVSARGRRRTP